VDLEEASWSKAVENYFLTSTPMLLSSVLGLLGKQEPEDRIALDVSQSIGAGAGLDTTAMWNTAISKTLARQDILGNIVKEVLNGVTRIVGWGLTTLVLYGNVFDSGR